MYIYIYICTVRKSRHNYHKVTYNQIKKKHLIIHFIVVYYFVVTIPNFPYFAYSFSSNIFSSLYN